MVKQTLSEYLTTTQQEDLLTLLTAYANEFATGDTTGRTNMVTHRMKT